MSNRRKFVVYPRGGSWRWKLTKERPRLIYNQRIRQTRHDELTRDRAILRILAQELLTHRECQIFLDALQQFRLTHSIAILCERLRSVVNTTQKLLLLVELTKRIPVELREDFRILCNSYFPYFDNYMELLAETEATDDYSTNIPAHFSGIVKIDARGSKRKVIRKYGSQRRRNLFMQSLTKTSDITSGIYSDADDDGDKITAIYNDESYLKHSDIDGIVPKVKDTLRNLEGSPANVRRVHINRPDRINFGMGITGGKEYGTEISINVVEEGSLAASQDLRIGDRVLAINGHSFHGISHAAAVNIISHATAITMDVVCSQTMYKATTEDDLASRNIGKMHDMLLVVFPRYNGRIGCDIQRYVLLQGDMLRTAGGYIHADKTYHVTKVDKNCPAFEAGFRIGDQLLKIDNINITDLSDHQIKMLTYSKRLVVHVRRQSSPHVADKDNTKGNISMPS